MEPIIDRLLERMIPNDGDKRETVTLEEIKSRYLKFIYSEKDRDREGHKILRNLPLTFDWHYIGQK